MMGKFRFSLLTGSSMRSEPKRNCKKKSRDLQVQHKRRRFDRYSRSHYMPS